MSNVGDSVGSHLLWTWQVLMIVERTIGGLAHPETIEEMDLELSKVIEDFDRAVNVEALRLVKEAGKYSLSHCRYSTFSPISFRARIFAWAAEICRGRP